MVRRQLEVSALTGVAARLVGRTTLHALFKLPVDKDGKIMENLAPLSGNYLEVLRNQRKDIEFLFIDEISMIPYEMLYMIDSRLRQLKKKESEPFGGINTMFLEICFSCHLFEELKHIINLKDSYRQLICGGPSSKLLTEASGDFDLDRAIHIYPTREQVDALNAAVLDRYRAKKVGVFKIWSQDVLINVTRSEDNQNMDNIISGDINKTGGLQKVLKISNGARVMLRSNINIEQGLVNGAMTIITEIVWPLFRRDQIYDTDIPFVWCVRINFGKGGIHLIKPKSVKFSALRNYGTIERTQFALILC
ncbi:ATP-dependent DNA helicase [Trichonephila inaurata madagascariensis]|uniref:ATP-dependent DNA helicase n=1 Tax=Trichonephila inaurata madagascariensis TaxID=2747483 RepID=A0A8X6XPF6_9ARAC|nr:ATP-dependent DNA helicase [Trichonephila inaurata madagascariensis]